MKLRIMLLTSAYMLMLTSCVQKEHKKTITFKVDMSAVDSVTRVGVRGQFTSPPWQVTIPMTDHNGDNIYEVTLTEKTAQATLAFKFVNHDDILELVNKPNRRLNFVYAQETLEYLTTFDVENGIQKGIRP